MCPRSGNSKAKTQRRNGIGAFKEYIDEQVTEEKGGEAIVPVLSVWSLDSLLSLASMWALKVAASWRTGGWM